MINQISSFLSSANLICRSMDMSKYFRESLRIRDNESQLYSVWESIQSAMSLSISDEICLVAEQEEPPVSHSFPFAWKI